MTEFISIIFTGGDGHRTFDIGFIFYFVPRGSASNYIKLSREPILP